MPAMAGTVSVEMKGAWVLYENAGQAETANVMLQNEGEDVEILSSGDDDTPIENNIDNILYGTAGMAEPKAPVNVRNSEWSGSYVYFGNWQGKQPIKFRVLDPHSNEFRGYDYANDKWAGKDTLFLDCDSILMNTYFNPYVTWKNDWYDSYLRGYINQTK